MKKTSFLLIFLSFCLFNAAAQKLNVAVKYIASDAGSTTGKPLIFYSPERKLTWNDFKGKPDAGSNAAAITNAGIGFQMMFRSENNVATLNIAVNCNFSIKDSWVKDGRRTPYILNHEQHHFDIAYIYAMLFIQQLKTAKYTMKDYAKVIEKIYTQTQADLLAMQNKYDGETKNSILTEQQEVWNKKIDAQVATLINIATPQNTSK